ncbi:polynucleotide adenylyltransferase PcnB [Algiphilus sp.]|uniref:polynucleotide adenylyltransferase PcnB n=1 Tax=Algiphilus sp. TaxID=1872431 RepID=UPI003B52E601
MSPRIPRENHPVSRKLISSAALKVLYTLNEAGYQAYLVGGGVRDILAGLQPKDFDISTNAHPEQVKALFRSCRLVGRRFVIAHVRFGREVIEVTTFRGALTDSHERDETGRILSDNVYGDDIEADALRRDFTVNGLYYDISDFSILDYVGGVADLQQRTIRLIGDAELRYREDPVRMLRAVRIANKLGFDIAPKTQKPIPRLAGLLNEVPPARLFDEVLKLLQSPNAVENFKGLVDHGLLAELFPSLHAVLHEPGVRPLMDAALANTARRICNEQSVTPAFLYATLLWPGVVRHAAELRDQQGLPPAVAMAQAADSVLADQVQRVAIPKRFSAPAREIWMLQSRFAYRRGKKPERLLAHPRFRAAYDFFCLRADAGEEDPSVAQWWTEAQEAPDALPPAPENPPEGAPKRRRRRRSRGSRSSSASQ